MYDAKPVGYKKQGEAIARPLTGLLVPSHLAKDKKTIDSIFQSEPEAQNVTEAGLILPAGFEYPIKVEEVDSLGEKVMKYVRAVVLGGGLTFAVACGSGGGSGGSDGAGNGGGKVGYLNLNQIHQTAQQAVTQAGASTNPDQFELGGTILSIMDEGYSANVENPVTQTSAITLPEVRSTFMRAVYESPNGNPAFILYEDVQGDWVANPFNTVEIFYIVPTDPSLEQQAADAGGLLGGQDPYESGDWPTFFRPTAVPNTPQAIAQLSQQMISHLLSEDANIKMRPVVNAGLDAIIGRGNIVNIGDSDPNKTFDKDGTIVKYQVFDTADMSLIAESTSLPIPVTFNTSGTFNYILVGTDDEDLNSIDPDSTDDDIQIIVS